MIMWSYSFLSSSKMQLLLTTCVILLLIFVTDGAVPSYLKACSMSDPDFEKCSVDSGNTVVQNLIKGDRKLGIPVLDPLKIKLLDMSSGESLKIIFENLEVIGLKDVKVEAVKFNIKEGNGAIDFTIPQLSGTGDYNISGQILVLPISGKGTFNLTGVNMKFHYTINFDKINVNGEQHLVTKDDKVEVKSDRIYYDLKNLFNGDENLGSNMNKFLNDNWNDVFQEVGGAFSEAVLSIGKSISTNIFSHYSYDELFLN